MKMLVKFAVALIACCTINAAIAQSAPHTVKLQGAASGPMILSKVDGAENLYRDSKGIAYEVKPAPKNATDCDSGGCTVKICETEGGKSPCVFYRCTEADGCKRLSQAS